MVKVFILNIIKYLLVSQLCKADIKIHGKDNIFKMDESTKHKQNQCRVIIEKTW